MSRFDLSIPDSALAQKATQLVTAMIEVLVSQVQCKPQIAVLTWMAELGRSHLPEFAGLNWQHVIRNSPFTE